MIVHAEILIELAPVHSASIDMHQASPGEMPVWTAPDDRKEIGVSGPHEGTFLGSLTVTIIRPTGCIGAVYLIMFVPSDSRILATEAAFVALLPVTELSHAVRESSGPARRCLRLQSHLALKTAVAESDNPRAPDRSNIPAIENRIDTGKTPFTKRNDRRPYGCVP